MRIPRIHEPLPLQAASRFELSEDGANHVGRVLRMQAGQSLILFDGLGGQYPATIVETGKRHVLVETGAHDPCEVESPLAIHLGQVISRGDRMEFTIQKSVELGVTCITPLFSDRCGVRLQGERLDKKRDQWQKIVIAACEQCGRNRIPLIQPVQDLEDWLAEPTDELKLNLHPRAPYSLQTLPAPTHGVRLLIGPEGGLSSEEIETARQHGFADMLLGPRVLRTETAAMTAITALQCRFGDLS